MNKLRIIAALVMVVIDAISCYAQTASIPSLDDLAEVFKKLVIWGIIIFLAVFALYVGYLWLVDSPKKRGLSIVLIICLILAVILVTV